ncbi:hypothetical protein [Oceanithermus sp.]
MGQVEVAGERLASLSDGVVLEASCDHLWFYDRDLKLKAEAVPFTEAGVCVLDLVVGDEGHVYVAGSISSAPAGYRDAFVARLTPAAEVVWTRRLGSESDDAAVAIALGAGGVVVGGYTNYELPGEVSNGGRDFFLASFSADGELLARRQLGTSASDDLSDLAVSGSAIYAAGVSEGRLPGEDGIESKEKVFLLRLDADLEPVWWWSAAAADVYEERGDARGPLIAVVDEGVLLSYVRAEQNVTALVRLGPGGAPVWENEIGTEGLDLPGDLLWLDGWGAFVLGTTFGAFPGYQEPVCGSDIEGLSRYSDAFLLRADAGGRTVAAVQFGGVGFDRGISLAAGPESLYLTYWKSGDSFGQDPVLYLARFDLRKL